MSRYGLEIRAATTAEALGLSALLNAAGHDITPSALSDRLDAIRQADAAALIATDGGQPTGLVVLHWYPTLTASQPTAQITTLLVHADERRRGIGRMLLKAAAQIARTAGCAEVELLASPKQVSLQAFCRATGFVEAGPRFVRGLRKRA